MRTLRTPASTLEPLTAAHAPEMFAALSDPAIYEFENEPPASHTWLAERYARLESRAFQPAAPQQAAGFGADPDEVVWIKFAALRGSVEDLVEP